MNRPQTKILLRLPAALLIAWLAQPATCQAWSLASQPVEGVLLLKNTNILRGKIQKQGDYFHIHLPNGKLQIREQQVETVCENLEAAYEYRLGKHGGSTADSHLDLAGWSIRHELYTHAQAELDKASSIDDDHPRLALLQRQLKQAKQMADYQREQEIAKAKVQPKPKPINPETLEKAPRWARALFVRQIQPLMVHSCATGGCHQNAIQSEFQLSRLAIDGVGHPGVTLRNLAATLERINWDTAEQSELLVLAREAHGGDASSEPLPPQKLRVLQSWVEQLAEANSKKNEPNALPEVLEVAEVSITPTLALNPPQLAIPKPTNPAPAGGVRTASYQPRDAFDPAVFNDRYGTAQRLPAPAAPESVAQVNTTEISSVPHVLVPSDPVRSNPVPTPLPATE